MVSSLYYRIVAIRKYDRIIGCNMYGGCLNFLHGLGIFNTKNFCLTETVMLKATILRNSIEKEGGERGRWNSYFGPWKRRARIATMIMFIIISFLENSKLLVKTNPL